MIKTCIIIFLILLILPFAMLSLRGVSCCPHSNEAQHQHRVVMRVDNIRSKKKTAQVKQDDSSGEK